jgi:hypothetical protein
MLDDEHGGLPLAVRLGRRCHPFGAGVEPGLHLRRRQERFAEAVPERVVGKPIDEVRVARLAGSSGTPDGFNAAIEKIRERAST